MIYHWNKVGKAWVLLGEAWIWMQALYSLNSHLVLHKRPEKTELLWDFLEMCMLVPPFLSLAFFKRRARFDYPSFLPPFSPPPRVKCHQCSVPGVLIWEVGKISTLKRGRENWRLIVRQVKCTVQRLLHYCMFDTSPLLFLVLWYLPKWERELEKRRGRRKKEEYSVSKWLLQTTFQQRFVLMLWPQ